MSSEKERERIGSAANAAEAILLTLKSLFKQDNVTGVASVELWVLLTTVLLVWRFVLDFSGPWFGKPSRMVVVVTLEILNQNLVIYTMGLMQLSGVKVNDYFQVWAVLLVTLQYSVKVGRPYTRSKQVPMLDLMSSFWSANLLRVQTFNLLRFPLWLIWSLNAVRIIVLFLTTGKGETNNQESMRLVSDYMSYEDDLSAGGDLQVSESDMRGCKYLVHGEHRVLKEIQEGPRGGTRTLSSCFRRKREIRGSDRSYKIRLDPDGVHKNQLVTVDKIWHDSSNGRLLGLGAAEDPRNQRKDLCLSFSLYKLLRRQFYDLPVHELKRPQGKEKIRKLVFDYILNDCERAFRIVGVELSFLQDLFYSKHAAVFAGGLMVPLRSLLLSLSLATATGYIAYPARRIPERMDPADRNRITHGVFITRLMVGIIVLKELLEIVLYVLSRWAKVLVLCKYLQHRCLRRPVVEMAMRFMLFFGSRAKWSQTIRQQNLLVGATTSVLRPTGVLPPLTWTLVLRRGVVTGKTALKDYTKNAILESLKKLEKSAQKKKKLENSAQKKKLENLDKKEGLAMDNYFSNAFKSDKRVVKWPRNLKVDTHIILVWHIATSLCEIYFHNKVQNLRAVRRPQPFVQDPNWIRNERFEQYATAATLSNYCAYLVRKALVPDNPIVAGMVIDEVIKEINHLTSKFSIKPRLMQLQDVYKSLMQTVHKPCTNRDHYQIFGWGDDVEAVTREGIGGVRKKQHEQGLHIGCSLTRMGAELGMHLREVYRGDTAGLWRDLANFWTGFLLHLAMNTSAATHGKHLAGDSELITHLWALLSHAGFHGNANDGEEGQDNENAPDLDLAVQNA
ncbi:hypothetical protein CFC21_077822 [Triticum aestivum]|uniref:DUF4220 domain-containing protein n=4 Tax=Triticinae TaxID=1648030 RepID=A0A3B6MR21_WHEAT|nr:uncharacterized protein LOC109773875 [Aegilops tauschii subsp. strangulata]KAF7072731.1 hypothetical protein CFC21_077822 [Triticum aestivum]